MSEKVLVLALIVAIGLVAYDDTARQGHFPPRPSRFMGVAIVFSILAILAVPAPALAAAFAVAVDVALLLRQSGQGQPASHQPTSQIPVMRGSQTVSA